MLTIYKYPFEITRRVSIDLPHGANVLNVECQNGEPCLWAAVNTAHPVETRRFLIFGTGHDMSDFFRICLTNHVATFQQGPFVWHMFEDVLYERPD